MYYNLTLTEEQLKQMFDLLDFKLRETGLVSLEQVVSLHNALASASKEEGYEEKQKDEKLITDSPRGDEHSR